VGFTVLKKVVNTTALLKNDAAPFSRFRHGFDLFLISVIILFLELAAIRWFPAHVLYLTFFTNVVLLASFMGILLRIELALILNRVI
jgi:hypothetical protein